MLNDEIKQKMMTLFEEIAIKENDISEVKTEIKESIDLFCNNNQEFRPKNIKEGYRFFKKLCKDKTVTVDNEFQRDKIIDILIGASNE